MNSFQTLVNDENPDEQVASSWANTLAAVVQNPSEVSSATCATSVVSLRLILSTADGLLTDSSVGALMGSVDSLMAATQQATIESTIGHPKRQRQLSVAHTTYERNAILLPLLDALGQQTLGPMVEGQRPVATVHSTLRSACGVWGKSLTPSAIVIGTV
jgi:hypothetical protein